MAERANIHARLKTLADGRAHRGLPDDEAVERFPDGSVKPYMVVQFGRPIPAAGERGMGVGERGQPYIMAFTVGCFAAVSESAEELAAAVGNLLIDFLPNGINADPIKGAGGYSYTRPIQQNRPSKFEEGCYFTTVINLSTS